MAATWRLSKVIDVGPGILTTNRTVNFVLRDDESGNTASVVKQVPKTTLSDPTTLQTYVCTQFNTAYTPNDFECA